MYVSERCSLALQAARALKRPSKVECQAASSRLHTFQPLYIHNGVLLSQVLLFYPDGKKSSSTEGHLAPPGLPAPGGGNGGGNQQGQVLHLPIPAGPIPGNANGTDLIST